MTLMTFSEMAKEMTRRGWPMGTTECRNFYNRTIMKVFKLMEGK